MSLSQFKDFKKWCFETLTFSKVNVLNGGGGGDFKVLEPYHSIRSMSSIFMWYGQNRCFGTLPFSKVNVLKTEFEKRQELVLEPYHSVRSMSYCSRL